MSTMKSKWRRVACSVILALFSGSVIAATLCSSQSAPDAAEAAAAGAPTSSVHDASADHASVSCDAPAYVGTMVSSQVTKQIGDAALAQFVAMASNAIGLVWSASPDVFLTRRSPVRPSARPPAVLALFSRLRI